MPASRRKPLPFLAINAMIQMMWQGEWVSPLPVKTPAVLDVAIVGSRSLSSGTQEQFCRLGNKQCHNPLMLPFFIGSMEQLAGLFHYALGWLPHFRGLSNAPPVPTRW
ncbi:MAG: hypothetical protein Q9P01_16715 [Anaerolineae bacterium]|nr:hypothetical protein [Anaerolineae bacterium]